MTEKKRHHYIPRFYLDGFIDPRNKPYIWVYEKGKNAIRKSKSDKIAFQKRYYSISTTEGKRDSETIENFLAEIEQSAALVFKKIEGRESLNEEEKGTFSYFLAFMITRVPAYRDNVERVTEKLLKKTNINLASDPRGFKAMIEAYERDTGEKIGMPVEELRQFTLDGRRYDISVDPQYSLQAMMIAKDIVPFLYNMSWAFFEASDDYKFVTSDNPLFYDDPNHDLESVYGVSLLNRNVEVSFPMSKELLFLGTWQDYKGFIRGNNAIVKDLNRRTVLSASRFVFASQKSDILNKFVQKYIDKGPRLELA
jgi:hypothetical protein